MLNPNKFNHVPSQEALVTSAFESPSYAFKWVHTPLIANEYGEILEGWEVSYLPSDEKGKFGYFFWDGVDAEGCFNSHIEVELMVRGSAVGAQYLQHAAGGPYVKVEDSDTYGLVGSRIICLSSTIEQTSWKPNGAIGVVWNGDFSDIEIVK